LGGRAKSDGSVSLSTERLPKTLNAHHAEELQSQVQLHSQLAKKEKLLEREKLRGRAMKA